MTPTRALVGLAAVAAAGYVAIHSMSAQGPQYVGDFPALEQQLLGTLALARFGRGPKLFELFPNLRRVAGGRGAAGGCGLVTGAASKHSCSPFL